MVEDSTRRRMLQLLMHFMPAVGLSVQLEPIESDEGSDLMGFELKNSERFGSTSRYLLSSSGFIPCYSAASGLCPHLIEDISYVCISAAIEC